MTEPHHVLFEIGDDRWVEITTDRYIDSMPARSTELDRARRGRYEWNQMSERGREALAKVVQHTLREMSTNVTDWLPDALTAEEDGKISVSLAFQFGRMDEAIVLRQELDAAEDAGRISDLERIAHGAGVDGRGGSSPSVH